MTITHYAAYRTDKDGHSYIDGTHPVFLCDDAGMVRARDIVAGFTEATRVKYKEVTKDDKGKPTVLWCDFGGCIMNYDPIMEFTIGDIIFQCFASHLKVIAEDSTEENCRYKDYPILGQLPNRYVKIMVSIELIARIREVLLAAIPEAKKQYDEAEAKVVREREARKALRN